MGGHHGTLWIPCGAALAAAGLYTLVNAGAGIRTVRQWIGWSLYGLGGVLIAGTVLESTGSFWSLLLFCVLCTAALLCATIGAVGHPGRDRNCLPGTGAAVAAILIWRGIYWTGGALLIISACLGAQAWLSRRENGERNSFRSFGADDAERVPHNTVREPALACLMWGLLMWGLMTALHRQTAEVDPDSARLNNVVAAAGGLLSLGVLEIVTRAQLRVAGLGSLLPGTLLVCSAGPDRGPSELLCLTALACVIVNAAVIVLVPRLKDPVSEPISPRGDA